MSSDPAIDKSPSIGLLGKRDESDADRGPVRRNTGGGRSLWFVWTLLVATIFATGSVAIWYLRQNAFTSSQREMANLSVVLAEQTSRCIQSVDLILQEVQAHVSQLGPQTPEEFRRQMSDENSHQFLAGRLQNLPQADAIAVVDADGMLLNWSRDRPVPHLDISDRDYVDHLRAHNEAGVFISGPTHTRVTGKWVMFIARRINGPRGELLGVAVGLIDTQYLEDFYRTISILPGEYVTVLRRDGIVIAGQPDIENRRGKHMPDQSPWYDRVAEGGGPYRSPGYFTGTPSIITVHPLHDYPLVVDVNMSERAVLKSWHQEAIGIAIATVSIALGFTALFWIIATQFRRQEVHAAELVRRADLLRARERQLHDFAEISSDWFWEQDADMRFRWMSQTALFNLIGDLSYVGKTRWELAERDGAEAQWVRHRADLTARRPFRDFRYQYRGIDGEVRHISVSGLPVFDEQRVFLGYRGTARDRLQREIGVTALFVTHDQDEAMTMADRIVVMNQGRIEQIGSPADIYDRPRTRFVADFIGSSNFFEGTTIRQGQTLALRCQSGLELPISAGTTVSNRATLAIRPEKIEFVDATASGALPGIIREMVLLGSVIEYIVELRSSDSARVQEQRRSGLAERRVGDTVAIAWRSEDAVLLE